MIAVVLCVKPCPIFWSKTLLPETTVCLFCFVSVEIERLMFSAKNQFFFNRIDPLETSPCELSSAVKKNE